MASSKKSSKQGFPRWVWIVAGVIALALSATPGLFPGRG